MIEGNYLSFIGPSSEPDPTYPCSWEASPAATDDCAQPATRSAEKVRVCFTWPVGPDESSRTGLTESGLSTPLRDERTSNQASINRPKTSI